MIRLLVQQPFDRGLVEITGDAAQHARVRRAQRADAIALLDGQGRIGSGVVESLDRKRLQVIIREIESVPPPTGVDVIVPVADRDRMLLAAEKCVELQITAWRPVYFARSRSVSPRGEGEKFREKLKLRMQSALEQSGGAWLPDIADEIDFDAAVAAVDAGTRHFVLDQRGEPVSELFAAGVSNGRVAIACGPEGGLESTELRTAVHAGWKPLALAQSTLRFETALIAAVAVVRAHQVVRSSD